MALPLEHGFACFSGFHGAQIRKHKRLRLVKVGPIFKSQGCFFNSFLRVIFGFTGTDTHGIKAFKAEPVRPLVEACQTRRDIFTTELVIRIERAGLWRCELPLEIEEKRPAPINIMRRVPSTLKNLWTLWKATRTIGRPQGKYEPVAPNGTPAEEAQPAAPPPGDGAAQMSATKAIN